MSRLAAASVHVRAGELTFVRVRNEPRLLLPEVELRLAGWAVSMLGQAKVDEFAFRILVFAALLLTPQEHHEVRVLLEGARFSEIRQPRLALLAHLRLPGQLGERDHRYGQFASECLQPARDLADLLHPV